MKEMVEKVVSNASVKKEYFSEVGKTHALVKLS